MPKYVIPQYINYEQYLEQLKNEDNPKAALFMLADSQLLFWYEEGFPWINVYIIL